MHEDQSTEAAERHVLTITVDNEAGILAKIAGLFTARGYNIDSLTVADITDNHAVSRITIVTHGPPRGDRPDPSPSSSGWCRCTRSSTSPRSARMSSASWR